MSIIQRSKFSNSTDASTLSPSTDITFRDPAIVSTLPFDPYYVRRYKTEEVLERTVRRWVWFDEALNIDPTLGALSYLPTEIRRHIWETVLQCNDTLSADGLWEYERMHGAPFNLSAYYFGFGRRWFSQGSANGIRLVSSSVRAEFEDVFLSMRTFRFNNPENLDAFINHLTDYQLSRLHSIAIGLSVHVPTRIGKWMGSMTRLPSSLQDIHLRIYPARNGWFEIGRTMWDDVDGREYDQEDVGLLDALVKQALQSAPKARVTICGAAKEHQLSTKCQAAVDAIIANSRQHGPKA
ncbi:hypothetical protein IMSHALPRED_008005 [Imshaugia aleurites]|uniref:Uncharacterized protein n=1 Tax=Imshaugia aleurites TaxID=172621 RepID=A0A8H3FYJ3_9LECA|nr:hypothetical protein IMSHALPRED_008005 [Imshaugia aleurites]